jgi:hypothetical protein
MHMFSFHPVNVQQPKYIYMRTMRIRSRNERKLSFPLANPIHAHCGLVYCAMYHLASIALMGHDK